MNKLDESHNSQDHIIVHIIPKKYLKDMTNTQKYDLGQYNPDDLMSLQKLLNYLMIN